jgi:hypothetical protein
VVLTKTDEQHTSAVNWYTVANDSPTFPRNFALREPAPFSLAAPVQNVLTGSRFCRRARALVFPGLAHLCALGEHIFFGVLEVLVDSLAFDHVAGTAAGYQVGRVLLALVSARHDEINGHDQRVFEAGPPIQSALSAAELIAFRNSQAFGLAYGHIHS